MERPVCYDVTRLLTRILNATPNGIDRVDFALATHFLGSPGLDRRDGTRFGATSTGFGSRLIDGTAAAEAVAGIAAHWRELDTRPEDDPSLQRVVAFLGGSQPAAYQPQTHRARRWRDRVGNSVAWIGRHGLPLTKTPRAHLPPRSIYLNVSQFPLWVASSFTWLEQRRDMRAVFFIHDLLPLRLPEYFRAGEEERHRKRLRNFARFGAAAIVTTQTVAADLEDHLATTGRRDCPIFVAPTPIAPIFSTPRRIDPTLGRHPYFVFCSTLEPRKNHLLLLAVWRSLVQRLGRAAPKLVLVGTRGWHYGAILDLIARSPALRDHVIEIRGLSTPGLKRLIDNACAVLMPSFGEGYGLPVHEALTAGVPVIASDIPVFREIVSDRLTLLSPLDGEAWLEQVTKQTRADRPLPSKAPGPASGADYFTRLERFLDAL